MPTVAALFTASATAPCTLCSYNPDRGVRIGEASHPGPPGWFTQEDDGVWDQDEDDGFGIGFTSDVDAFSEHEGIAEDEGLHWLDDDESYPQAASGCDEQLVDRVDPWESADPSENEQENEHEPAPAEP